MYRKPRIVINRDDNNRHTSGVSRFGKTVVVFTLVHVTGFVIVATTSLLSIGPIIHRSASRYNPKSFARSVFIETRAINEFVGKDDATVRRGDRGMNRFSF